MCGGLYNVAGGDTNSRGPSEGKGGVGAKGQQTRSNRAGLRVQSQKSEGPGDSNQINR